VRRRDPFPAPELVLNLIGSVLLSTGHRVWLESSAWHNLRWTADQSMVALPIALAYGVLKHRLLDISVVVRRGLRYILARRMLQGILILPFLGLLLPMVSHPDRTLRDLLLQSSSVINLLLLALIDISLRYRQQMRAWLDRRFFREAYRQEDILRRLIHRIGDAGSAEEVSSLVCKELESALHPKWLYVCQWKSASEKLAVVRSSPNGPIGTLAYMSPEQIRGEPADERSDIFSVGVMAVEAITGKLPRRNVDGTVIAGALFGQLRVEDGARESALRQILLECLADDPELRCSPVTTIRRNLVNACAMIDRIRNCSMSIVRYFVDQ
jgi:hypothetical protein